MKVLSVLVLLILSGSIYASCPALESLLSGIDNQLQQADKDKKDAWDQYASNCGAGGATDLKGKGNMCIYKDGWEIRYVHAGNTVPVPKCGSLTCYSGLGDIIGVLAWSDIFNILGSLTSDSNLTGYCKEQCELWKVNDNLINKDLPAQREEILKTAEAVCTSPCRGLPDEAYRKCECERKDQKIWTWDESKDPKACVACKSKEGKGEEYNKCMCENVQEGIWDSEEKNCYGKSCAGKTGDDYKKCICEVEKRGVWDTKKKLCNYIPDPSGGGSIVPPGPSDTGVEDAGAGYTAEGAAGAGMSDSSSFGGGGDSGFGLDKNSGKTGSKTKKSGGPWYKNLLGAMGFGGMGSYGGPNKVANSTEEGRKVTPYSDKKVEVKKPTDIGASSDDDIFAQITETLDKNYRSATIGAPVAKGAGSL